MTKVKRAYDEKEPVRLIVVTETDPDDVETGRNVNTLGKVFDPEPKLIGEVVELNGSDYIFRLRRA